MGGHVKRPVGGGTRGLRAVDTSRGSSGRYELLGLSTRIAPDGLPANRVNTLHGSVKRTSTYGAVAGGCGHSVTLCRRVRARVTLTPVAVVALSDAFGDTS